MRLQGRVQVLQFYVAHAAGVTEIEIGRGDGGNRDIRVGIVAGVQQGKPIGGASSRDEKNCEGG